jgi:SAM-dependent methyltransferase
MNDEARRFFDAIAPRYDRVYALPPRLGRERMRRVLSLLPSPPARVLDLGVGTGRELSALLDAGHRPTGVDVSPRMLELCGRRARPVPLFQADFWSASALPFAVGAFDAAVALHGTLAHPPGEGALERLGAELARVLRPSGILLAEVPSPAWLERLDDARTPTAPVRRTGPRSCVVEDPATGARLEARVLSGPEWERALGPGWSVNVEPLGEVEWLVRATRAG